MKIILIITFMMISSGEDKINKFETALNKIKQTQVLKSIFRDIISVESDIQFYVSDTTKFIDPQFFIDEIISYKIGR